MTRSTERSTEWRRVLGLIIGFWLVQMLLLTAQRVASGMGDGPGFVIPRSLATTFGILVSLGMWLVLRRRNSWWGILLSIIWLVPLAALLHSASNFLLFDFFYGEANRRQLTFASYLMAVISWGWAYLALAGLITAWIYVRRTRDEEQRNLALRETARTAQLDALRYQIRPHFLFNTLNAVAALIHIGKSVDAEAMVENLSDYMRMTLDFSQAEFVSLADEVRLQRLYLDIEQSRFPARLAAMIDVPESLADIPVPSLILQPIVENAIKHGVARRRDLTRVTITAEDGDNVVRLTVANDVDSAAAGNSGHGIGLANVARRLDLLYGERAQFAAGDTGAGRFVVSFCIPRDVP